MMDYANNDGNTSRASASPKKEHFIAWLKTFSEKVGDYMPNEECIVLPYPKFEGVFMEYNQEMHNRNEAACHYSYACRIFAEEVENIRLVRSKGAFVCCKVCTSYQTRILKAKTHAERENLKQLRLQHVEKQRQERINYYSHREAAIACPDHVLSIIMDGMDQSKTSVPLYSRRTSDRAMGFRLVGVKVHGIGNYVYLVDSTVKGGANLMTEILRLTLLDLEKQNKLPTLNPILYLQLDNCSENKNKVLFGFLSDLVGRGVFEEIHTGFLMVGHTHEDIDQFFSVISAWLRKWETICPDIEALENAIIAAFSSKSKPPPKIIRLHAPQIFDYDSFYIPQLNEKLAYHSVPHQFRFKSVNGTVLCHYKMWSTHSVWLPEQKPLSDPAPPQPVPAPTHINVPNNTNQVAKKKRTHVRGAAKPHLKRQKLGQTTYSSDSSTDALHEADGKLPSHPIYDDNFAAEDIPPQGIKWITSPVAVHAVPSRVHISDEKCAENWKACQAMYSHIINKCRPLNPAIFDEKVLANWNSWIANE